ncbi:MAG: hypothetical protein LCH30_11910 [Proteobacteria bacterium]|nr:hypothetical protein [Pseudomonadota bacterium]
MANTFDMLKKLANKPAEKSNNQAKLDIVEMIPEIDAPENRMEAVMKNCLTTDLNLKNMPKS